jgi:hypothetical protein
VRSQTRRLVWLQRLTRRNGLAVSRALRVGAAPVDLKVRIRCLAVEDLAGCLRHVGLNGVCILLHLRHVRLRVWRGKVGLAFLQVFDLPRRVLCAHEAAMQAAHLVTFRRRVLVLKLGLLANVKVSACHMCTWYGTWASHKGSPYVWVGVPAHPDGEVLLP